LKLTALSATGPKKTPSTMQHTAWVCCDRRNDGRTARCLTDSTWHASLSRRFSSVSLLFHRIQHSEKH